MNPKAKKAVKFVIRWGIAVLGIGWVVSNISIYNRVLIENPSTHRPVPARLATPADEGDAKFQVLSPFASSEGAGPVTLARTDLFVKSDWDKVAVRGSDGKEELVEVLGLKVTSDENRAHWPLVVARPRTFWMKYTGGDWGDPARLVQPSQVIGNYYIRVPYPLIDTGLGPMTRQAMENNPLYLLAAIFVFPITFLITSFRWHMLLELLDIHMGIARTGIINMVGAFYNTFMPGSTGGDVLKAYYAAKLTPHRTRAVMSVLVDRAIGLLALVILGGTMAAYQYARSPNNDAATIKCGQVALGSAAIIGATVLGLLVFYLRKPLGIEFLMRRLPMQRQVTKAIETMEIYRRHPLTVLWTIVMTLPVHGTVVLSAMFAGLAFGLPMASSYYWVCVPVIVLSGAIPISPQGAGVMEFFAILLTRSQGVTVSQAFALTMSLRIVQILWNLTGGIFVLRGGFHPPTTDEQSVLESDLPDNGALDVGK